jgi:hypothetical protein
MQGQRDIYPWSFLDFHLMEKEINERVQFSVPAETNPMHASLKMLN